MALVVLLSVNVLSPISYALDNSGEMETIPENGIEDPSGQSPSWIEEWQGDTNSETPADSLAKTSEWQWATPQEDNNTSNVTEDETQKNEESNNDNWQTADSTSNVSEWQGTTLQDDWQPLQETSDKILDNKGSETQQTQNIDYNKYKLAVLADKLGINREIEAWYYAKLAWIEWNYVWDGNDNEMKIN